MLTRGRDARGTVVTKHALVLSVRTERNGGLEHLFFRHQQFLFSSFLEKFPCLKVRSLLPHLAHPRYIQTVRNNFILFLFYFFHFPIFGYCPTFMPFVFVSNFAVFYSPPRHAQLVGKHNATHHDQKGKTQTAKITNSRRGSRIPLEVGKGGTATGKDGITTSTLRQRKDRVPPTMHDRIPSGNNLIPIT